MNYLDTIDVTHLAFYNYSILRLLSRSIMAAKNLPLVDWLEIEASAPAKFIISGEYSVIFEKEAIATAIDLRTHVTVRPNNDGKVRLRLKNLESYREWPTTSFAMCKLVGKYSDFLDYDDNMPPKLNHLLHSRYYENSSQRNGDAKQEPDKKADDAAMAFLLLYIGLGDSYASSARPSIDVEVDSAIPVGSGLGSSSAYSVAICAALMRVYRVSAERYIISTWAFNVDKFFHGKPSGVDNNIVTSGGHILFQNGKVKSNGVAHETPIQVMLIDTGVSRSTKSLSELVIKQYKENPSRMNNIFDSIHELTGKIWRKMNEPSFKPRTVANYIQVNQDLLDSLGVGHEKLTDICNRAAQFKLAAKLTGAGGGGSAFVLYDDSDKCTHVAQLRSDLEAAGYHVHDHPIGCEGVQVKVVPDQKADQKSGKSQ